jgi:hypothetical protein
MKDGELDRNMAWVAVAVGVTLFLHSAASLVLVHADKRLGGALSALLLLIAGMLISLLNVGLYNHLREVHETFALWLLIIGSFTAFGLVAHGGYDLAVSTQQTPDKVLDTSGEPHAVDPFGMLTFGLTGITVAGWTWLKGKSNDYHSGFVRLGYTLAVLLAFIFLGRLLVLDPEGGIMLGLLAITGLALHPAWYLWLGRHWKDWT